MADVLPGKENFRIVRLAEGDVRCRTDHYEHLKGLVLNHEEMYPDIGNWFRKKVTPGVCSAERVAFVGYLDERPCASAIVKRGAEAKFCHLHVTKGIQDINLGEVFFSLMANEVRDLAERVYFTLPESVWNSKGGFFRSFNFNNLHKADAQYRLFEDELKCDAPFQEVWRAVAEKLPKLCGLYSPGSDSLARDLLFSIRPQYASRIFDGSKRYELRKKFSTKWLGHRINIYATEPASELVGQATVRSVVRSTPASIWAKLGPDLGCEKVEFERYTQGSEEIYAIELSDVTPFRVPLPRKEVGAMLDEALLPPQSYCTVEASKGWGRAVTLAQWLQGAFRAPVLRCWDATRSDGREVAKRSPIAEIQLRRMLT